MKNVLILFLILYTNISLFAAATFDNTVTATQLATKIQGKGITITNPVITRGQIGTGNSQVAVFSNGIAGANLLIDEGILLTASTAIEAFSTNDSGSRSANPGNINNVTGLPVNDPDLMTTISQNSIFNQVVFEFDVTLDDNTRLLLVDYQFASDEYPEWVGSQYNDAFGFFISGGDLTQTLNIARVVDNSIVLTTANLQNFPPVNINNVNNGVLGFHSNGTTVDLNNSQYFIDNGGTNVDQGGLNAANVGIESEFDGFTTRLHATLDNLTPGQTYHFKMALADTSDAAWDAGVFVNKIIGVRVPSVCYDYDVRIGNDLPVPSENNDIIAAPYPNEQLQLGIALQSLEGELSLLDTNLSVIFTPNDKLRFDKAYLSPDSINAYELIPDALVNKFPYAQIPIGENITSAGGTIGENQVIFSKLYYDFNSTSGYVNTHFELTSNITLSLNGIRIARTISTANGTLQRCPTQGGYHPEWASVNVERRNSHLGTPEELHLLYTQISGRPFDIDVVSYDANTSTAIPKALNNVTFELELIDAGKYSDSDKSLFTCREPSSVGQSQFVKFPNNVNSERVQVDGFQTDRALKNAAFRLWYFADQNNSTIKYTCNTYSSSACFNPLWNSEFKDKVDTVPYKCASACSTGDCYQCLKKYFARPICTRDNFSVRPESYRISVSDNLESNVVSAPSQLIGDNTSTSLNVLAAGYKYKLDGNATLFNLSSSAPGYYGQFQGGSADLVSQFQLNMPPGSSCPDNANKDIKIVFYNGKIMYAFSDDSEEINFETNNLYAHPNVGQFLYHVEDNNWTIVDQTRYEYKTFPDTQECESGSATVSVDGNKKSGCQISTILSDKSFYDLSLQFHPYQFNLSGLTFSTTPNDNGAYVYMNDLSKSLGMAVTLDGNITAEGKNGITLSNFTATCAAEDLNLWLDKNMTHNGLENTTTVYAEDGSTPVNFQQDLNTVLSSDGNNSTLSKAQFSNNADSNGSAVVSLSYNFAKPYALPVNPIDVNFTKLHAISPNAQSYAQQVKNYTPEGNLSINQSRYFYFAKVAPLPATDNEQVYSLSTTTTLRVNTYCDTSTNITDCSTLPNMYNDTSPWYLMKDHFSGLDGQVNSLSTTTSAVTISPNSNIVFSNNGVSPAITIAHPMAGRAVYPRIIITPDEWLKYNADSTKNGLPEFTIQFLNQGLKWKGEGETGHVIETEPHVNTSPRMNW